MIRKEIVIILCLATTVAKTRAQELNVWENGGWQGLSYKIQNGQSKLLPDGSLGLGYTFPISRHWGLVTGLTGEFFGTKATLHDGTYSSDEVDNTGTAFQYNVKTAGYQETQRFFSFGVPLMLQYHTTGSRTQWYLNGGGKLLMPLNVKVKASAQQLDLTGYYPDFNLNLSSVPQHGFAALDNWRGSTTYDLKSTSVAGVIETGLCFVLSRNTKLYAGVYFEYGLDNSKDGNGTDALVPYSLNGITAMHAGTVLNTPNAGDARLLAYGLQVKWGIGHFKTKSGPRVQPPPPTSSVQVQETPPPAQPKDSALVRIQEAPRPAATSADAASPKRAPEQPSQPRISREETGTIEQPVVFSVLGKTDLPKNVKPHLDEVADILNKYPDVRILIIGHTCDIGTEAQNLKVGMNRAQAVVKYLESKGVRIDRMEYRSAGESNPAWPNSTPAGRSKNRTVIIECINRPFE